MEILSNIFTLIATISFILLIIGLFSPGKALFWVKDTEKRTRLLSFIVYFIIVLFAVFLINITSDPNENTKEKDIDTQTEVTESSKSKDNTKEQMVQNWEYSTSIDEMTDNKLYYACCSSLNSHEFSFPYNGGSELYLCIRYKDGKNDVYLKISNGQIMSSFANNEYIRIKYDDGKAETYSYNDAADGSTDIAFLVKSNEIIKKLRNAKTIKIDLPIFQESRPIFEFNVEGLEWEY